MAPPNGPWQNPSSHPRERPIDDRLLQGSLAATLTPRRRPARWLVPLCVLAGWFAVAAVIRIRHLGASGAPALAVGSQVENRFVEIAQAALLGLACVLCLWAMVRGGRRNADFTWWIAPAFICFFMFWREIEIDERYFHAHAFSWNYLISSSHHDTAWTDRLILAVPSIFLTLVVAVLCLRHARLLLPSLTRRDLRVGLFLLAAGLALYLVAQVYDRGHGLLARHGISLPGFVSHRDDFWEETLELAGALAIFMGILDLVRRRPIIPGTLAKARTALAARRSPEAPTHTTGT